MKKMYKKPITDTIPVNTDELMDTTLGVSSGGTNEIGPVTGNAPKRRTDVF